MNMLETNSQTVPSKNLKWVGILAIALAFVFGGVAAALAQQATKVPRIGYQGVGSPDENEEEFRQGLRELGYVEG